MDQPRHGSFGFHLVRLHIPTGIETILPEGTTSDLYRPIQYHWADGHHGLLFREDSSVDLMDFRTKELMKLTGLPRCLCAGILK